MFSENNNFNAPQWPTFMEQETMIEQQEPLHERWKSSDLQTTNQCNIESPVSHSEYNPLSEPCLLGLKLKKSPSALELYEAELRELGEACIVESNKDAELGEACIVESNKDAELGETCIVERKKDAKPRGRPRGQAKASGPVAKKTKTTPSNFHAKLLRIGKWEYVAKNDINLVAKFYLAKHKIIWEVFDGELKNKIEFNWEDIVGLEAHCPDDEPGTLSIVLNKKPLFFKEINPQPRRQTVWEQTDIDFTGGEASTCSKHYLECAPGVLDNHFENLINCDTRLRLLSQHALNDSVKDSNALYNIASSSVNHGDITEQSKDIAPANATMLVPDIGAWEEIPTRVNEINQNQVVLTGTPLTTPSDERSPVSGVNSQCGIVWDGNGSNGYFDNDVGNFLEQETGDGNEGFTPSCDPTPENENVVSGVNSLFGIDWEGNESNGYLDTNIRNFRGQEWVDGNDCFTPWGNPTPENENGGMSMVDSFDNLATLFEPDFMNL